VAEGAQDPDGAQGRSDAQVGIVEPGFRVAATVQGEADRIAGLLGLAVLRIRLAGLNTTRASEGNGYETKAL
jgi:hypothetical protein